MRSANIPQFSLRPHSETNHNMPSPALSLLLAALAGLASGQDPTDPTADPTAPSTDCFFPLSENPLGECDCDGQLFISDECTTVLSSCRHTFFMSWFWQIFCDQNIKVHRRDFTAWRGRAAPSRWAASSPAPPATSCWWTPGMAAAGDACQSKVKKKFHLFILPDYF